MSALGRGGYDVPEAGAVGEVVVGAAQRAFDQVETGLGCRQPVPERLAVRFEALPAGPRVTGPQQFADVVECETRSLGPEDDGDAGDVGGVVAAAGVGIAGGLDESGGFPVPQHVGGQTEPAREFADAHRRGRTA